MKLTYQSLLTQGREESTPKKLGKIIRNEIVMKAIFPSTL